MAIYSVLKHRATVKRSARTFEDGRAAYEWFTVAIDVPCLLDAVERSEDSETEFQKADRRGALLSGPGSPMQPGDRVVMTRGAAGTFLIRDDPEQRANFHGISHREHGVEQVA
ncbi:hypothetical protein [Aeromicrobium sp.]|uniref:hypothetical protein n=1 Tax=Aeromicrobium sp. TaxID=1871063 RepID=UPI0030C2C2B1